MYHEQWQVLMKQRLVSQMKRYNHAYPSQYERAVDFVQSKVNREGTGVKFGKREPHGCVRQENEMNDVRSWRTSISKFIVSVCHHVEKAEERRKSLGQKAERRRHLHIAVRTNNTGQDLAVIMIIS